MRRGILLLAFSSLFVPVRADRAAELAGIHVEAMGGSERIAALVSLRATGLVAAGGKQVRFTLFAARPDKVRIETEAGGRTLVQATDGVDPAWEFDTGNWPPRYRTMPEANARLFVADAEFDDPLVAGAARGYTLDFAGELVANGRKFWRILVTRKLTETYSLLLDSETYLIAKRIENRSSAGGRNLQVITHYDDFRPVQGVLLPHQITVAVDGAATQQTQVQRIEANPKLADDAFTRPKVAPAAEAAR